MTADHPSKPGHDHANEGEHADGETDGPHTSMATGPFQRRRLSEILNEVGQDTSRDEIAVNDLIALLGSRGRAALILIFAFPNVLPAPPGVSGLLGLPLLYLSLQMMLGKTPWLPKFIGERSIPRGRFAQMFDRLAPWLARAERLLSPRWLFLVGPSPERALGMLCLVLAAVLALPIPLGNMLPAMAICMIALGILERDGVWVFVGLATGLVSLGIASAVVYALIKAAIFLLLNAFT